MKRLAERALTLWLVGLVEVGAWLLHLPHQEAEHYHPGEMRPCQCDQGLS